MGEYRFGLHSGEVSEYLFGVHYGHLTAPADQIAGRHGAWHVNYTDPHGQRRGWFACPNRGAQFDQAIARAVMADIDLPIECGRVHNGALRAAQEEAGRQADRATRATLAKKVY